MFKYFTCENNVIIYMELFVLANLLIEFLMQIDYRPIALPDSMTSQDATRLLSLEP